MEGVAGGTDPHLLVGVCFPGQWFGRAVEGVSHHIGKVPIFLIL